MRTSSRQSGYSFIELVVVMAIVAILALASGIYVMQPRQKPAVQNLMSEIEGLLADAHKYSGATLGNVVIESAGGWADGYQLSYRQVALGSPAVNSVTFGAFQDRRFAGIDTTAGTAEVALAVGSETLAAALATTPDLATAVNPALSSNLAGGGAGSAQINAFNKQFLTPFCIPVVGLREGVTYAGAPAGYVVVNGNRIYKFYKAGPGPQNPWRRL